jgi:CBS domain-containing protein
VAVLAWIGNINAAILIFNLLPAFPLDGGRIVRAAAWRFTGDREKATLFAARLGQVFAFLFIALGVALLFAGSAITGIWLAVIGWLLGSSARATAVRSELNRRLGDLKVADVMDSEPVAIPSDTTVDRALDEYFLRYRWPWFPVVDTAQRFVGLINRGAADAVPVPSRDSQTVSDVIDAGRTADDAPLEDQVVRSDEPLDALLANVELRRLGGLAAVDADGRLIGIITLDQVGRALRKAVGPTQPGSGFETRPPDDPPR